VFTLVKIHSRVKACLPVKSKFRTWYHSTVVGFWTRTRNTFC